jgi:hypothetical protein
MCSNEPETKQIQLASGVTRKISEKLGLVIFVVIALSFGVFSPNKYQIKNRIYSYGFRKIKLSRGVE